MRDAVIVRDRRCPECKGMLKFEPRHPILSASTTNRSPSEGPAYLPAWVCQNPRCDYRELTE